MAILRLSGFVVFSSNDRAGTKYLDVVVLPNSVLPLGVVQYLQYWATLQYRGLSSGTSMTSSDGHNISRTKGSGMTGVYVVLGSRLLTCTQSTAQ